MITIYLYNSTAGTIQVQTHLQEQLSDCNFEHENLSQCIGKQPSRRVIRWKKMKTCKRHFVLTLTINEILTFEIFDLETGSQGHPV